MRAGGCLGLSAETSGRQSPHRNDARMDRAVKTELAIIPEAPSTEAPVLLVDDRTANLVALEAILEPLGHPLVRAVSGKEALLRLLEREFAVILMDVQMPGLDGFQTARIIKERERSRHTPIIFLTAIHRERANIFSGY